MAEELWGAVDGMMASLFAQEDDALSGALADSSEAGLPEIAVSPLYGKLLFLLARTSGARRILEVGTLGGYSSIWLARAIPVEGRLVTLEANPEHARVARSNLERAGVSERVQIEVGPAADTLARLIEEDTPPFDFVFLDADKENLADYLDASIALSHSGTLVVADNVVRDGRVVDDTTDDPMVRGVQRFLARAAADPRLETTVLQTVGSKGYDGLSISIVTDQP